MKYKPNDLDKELINRCIKFNTCGSAFGIVLLRWSMGQSICSIAKMYHMTAKRTRKKIAEYCEEQLSNI